MQKKWYNPKKSMIRKHNLALHYEYKPVIYGSKKQIDFLVDSLLKDSDKKKFTVQKKDGLYMLSKKIKFYRKKE